MSTPDPTPSETTLSPDNQPIQTITLLGTGTIGLSFLSLLLTHTPSTTALKIYDPRPNLHSYILSTLPTLLNPNFPLPPIPSPRLTLSPTLTLAVQDATHIIEQTPETAPSKQSLWAEVEKFAPSNAQFFSSTSGIPASVQSLQMKTPGRLIVCHPYNPPHIMPLIEIVPSQSTPSELVSSAERFWERELGMKTVVVKKEVPGFVANRLAFALFREACSLVANGVVSVEEVDAVVTSSCGPRWAVAGPFKAYHAGGGEGGLRSFMEKIGGTVQDCWEAGEEDVKKAGVVVDGEWQEEVCRQAEEAYGVVDTGERDRKTRKVLEAVKEA